MRVWLHIAKHVGCTIAEAQERVSSPEFNLWFADYVESQQKVWEKGSDPSHYYFAAILQAIVAATGGKVRGLTDYLIEFQPEKQSGKLNHQLFQQTMLHSLGVKDGERQ